MLYQVRMFGEREVIGGTRFCAIVVGGIAVGYVSADATSRELYDEAAVWVFVVSYVVLGQCDDDVDAKFAKNRDPHDLPSPRFAWESTSEELSCT